MSFGSERLARHMGLEKPTPVWLEFATPGGATSHVRNSIPGVEAAFEQNHAKFIPVARLRSDQRFLKDRLEERGIKCYVDGETKRHVSDLMIQAGVDRLLGLCPQFQDSGIDIHNLVRSTYAAMESKR